MKQTLEKISIEEAERLCQLYMDCQLSVLEETELEFVLSQAEIDSLVIRETRELMGISRSVKFSSVTKHQATHILLKWGLRVAACVIILLACVTILRNDLFTDDVECIAFVEGHQVSTEQARNIAESDVAKMEQFMQIVATRRAAEEAKVKQFINNETPIYIITVHSQCCQHLCQSSQVECGEPLRRQIQQQ